MIYIAQINVCDVCGKIESFAAEGDEYEETSINYPKGWIIAWKDPNTPVAHCPDCFQKHTDELERIDPESDIWLDYEYK